MSIRSEADAGRLPSPAVDGVQDASPALAASDATTLARGASIAIGGMMAGRLLRMVAQLVMARLLGAAMFGIYAIGWTLIRMVGAFSMMGMNNGVIYFGVRYREAEPRRFRGLVFDCVGMAAIAGIGAGVLIWVAAPWMAAVVFAKPAAQGALQWFAPGFAIFAAVTVANSATRISQRTEYNVAADLTTQGLDLGLFLLLYVMGYRLGGAITATVIALAGGLVVSLLWVRKLFPGALAPGFARLRTRGEVLEYSLPLAVSAGALGMTSFMDRLFVGSYGTAAEMGAYQAASQLALLFGIMSGAMGSIFGPMIADLHHRGEHRRSEELLRVATKWGMYAGIPLLLFIAFSPAGVLGLLYGKGFERGATALVILSAGQLVALAAGPIGLTMMLTGNQRTWIALSMVALSSNIVINIALVPRLGMLGAALAGAGSLVILCGTSLQFVNRYQHLRAYDFRHLKPLAAGITTAIVMVLVCLFIYHWAIPVFVSLLMSYGVFALASIELGIDKEDADVFQALKSKMRRRSYSDL